MHWTPTAHFRSPSVASSLPRLPRFHNFRHSALLSDITSVSAGTCCSSATICEAPFTTSSADRVGIRSKDRGQYRTAARIFPTRQAMPRVESRRARYSSIRSMNIANTNCWTATSEILSTSPLTGWSVLGRHSTVGIGTTEMRFSKDNLGASKH